MHMDGRPVGLLLADHAFEPRRVGAAEVELLELLAGQAAVALHRGILIEKLRENAYALEAAARENHANQRRLLRAERLGAVGQMAAQIAHDIRTPLVVIGGYARSLSEDASLPAEARETLGIVVGEVRRLEGIVNSVLAHAREPLPELRPVDVGRLVREAIELLRYELDPAGVRVAVDVAPGTPRALADRDLLFQALINLIHNAVQALPDGGTLRLAAEREEGRVAIRIRDEGVGIPRDLLDRVLEPFFTTRPNGTGLGLPIVHTIVRAHGGDLEIDSREGVGTSVRMRMAAAAEVVPARPVEGPAPEEETSKGATRCRKS